MTATLEAVRTTNEDDTRTYPYPPTGEELWSVTTVIGATNSKPWIKKWYGSSAMAWAVDHLSLLARTLRATDEGRKVALSLGKDEAERVRKVKADAGTYVHDSVKGAELGVMLGVGLVAARHATNALFELKTLKHYLIVSGYDVALLAIQGAILGVWR